jgi:predicted RNA-binding protein with PUA-like domain
VRRVLGFCDEPLRHGEYFNASPFWQREGYGRRNAWRSISPGDDVLLYCSGSVDEHRACLSHLLTVGDVSRDKSDGAQLDFSEAQELDPKISYGEIQDEISADCFSD